MAVIQNSLHTLPVELFLKICILLPPIELSRITYVNRQFMSSKNDLWNAYFRKLSAQTKNDMSETLLWNILHRIALQLTDLIPIVRLELCKRLMKTSLLPEIVTLQNKQLAHQPYKDENDVFIHDGSRKVTPAYVLYILYFRPYVETKSSFRLPYAVNRWFVDVATDVGLTNGIKLEKIIKNVT